MDKTMIYIEFGKNLCETKAFAVNIGETFVAKKHGVVPTNSGERTFNCRIGDYEEECVQVSMERPGRKVVLFDEFTVDNIGKLLKRSWDDTFYGIFKTKESAKSALRKVVGKTISSIKSELKRLEEKQEKTLKTIDELKEI
jgi:hypothetical protein